MNSYQHIDDDFLLGKVHRTVLPPTRNLPGNESNKLPSLVLESNKLPSLVPEILLRSLQEGHRIKLSRADALQQPATLRFSTQADDREDLSPVRSVNHRTVLPKTFPDASSSWSQRRVVLPQGKSRSQHPETSEPTQQEQPDSSRLSTSLQTMARQVYEEELEFLKLKLRYMQNDIEFKQKQLDSAKMSKLKSKTTANNWSTSNQNGSVQGGAFRMVQQTTSSHGSPAQQSKVHHRLPATTWAVDAAVSLPQAKTAASVLHKYSDLQEQYFPSSLPTISNKSDTSTASRKPSLVTGSSKSYLTTESYKSSVPTGGNKSSLVTESNKSPVAAGSNKYFLAAGSNRSSMAAENNNSSAAYLWSSRLSPDTTLNKWKPVSGSANVRTVYPSCERAFPSHKNTAHINHLNSVSPQQTNVATNQIVHKQTEQTTPCPADPGVVTRGIKKEIPYLNLAAAAGSPSSVFDRLGSQRISEVSKFDCESPDKRLVVSSKVPPAVPPAASVALDLTQTLGHTTSSAVVVSEPSVNSSIHLYGGNIEDVSYREAVSYYPHSVTCADSGHASVSSSATSASKYRFVNIPSYLNVDVTNTTAASTVSSISSPSSVSNSPSSYSIPNKDREAAWRGSQVSRLSLHQNPNSNIPAITELISKYKLKRLSPAQTQQEAPQLFPTKMLLRRTSSGFHQVDSKVLGQNARIQDKFVSKYNLIKTPSRVATISNGAAASGVNIMALPSALNDSNICQNPVSTTQPLMAAVAARRSSQSSRLSLRNPNLKIHTAAKLVSKYKLKRLSPTLAPQAAPVFYNRPSVYRPSSLAHNRLDNKTPGQYSVNKLKLDRRLTVISPANPKVDYKKFSDDYSNKLAKKLKIDRRPAIGQSPRVSNASLSLCRSKLKIDKRMQPDAVFLGETNGPVYTGKNAFDRRLSKGGLYKLEVVSKQTAVDRRNKHRWMSPQPVAGAVGKVRSGTRLSSKYSWKKAGLPAAQSSRFKWSRPNVQVQNEAWQQLRQKLQLLLMKKHRHSRYNLFKYPTRAAAAPSIYSRRPQVGDYKTNLVTIDGVTYKSSTCKLTRTKRLSSRSALKRAAPAECRTSVGSVSGSQRQTMKLISLRGVHFHVDQSGKKLCRTQSETIPGVTTGATKSIACRTDIKAVNYANRVIHRSIAIAAAKYKKTNKKPKTPHCKFFSRFGKCHRGDNCPYVHDPEKVAVCTRFLRGRCDVKDCPFSHKASVNKMPVCLFYLRGSCSRDSCPYLHVRVNPSAPVCKDFRSGFCALGEKCKKIHSHVCPSFAMTGVCSRADMCTMLHRASKKEKEPPAQDKLIKKSSSQQNQRPTNGGECRPGKSTITPDFTVPLAAQPSFISLGLTPTSSSLVATSTQSVTAHVRTPAPSFTALGPMPSFISLGTTATPSFISLGTTTTPSFISLRTTTTPSFISLGTTPKSSFISLGTTATSSFISLGTIATTSFISLRTTTTPSFSSHGTTPTPSFISLGATPTSFSSQTTPAASFISLGTTPTPSFISQMTTPTPSFNSLGTTPTLGTSTTPAFISLETTPTPGTPTTPSFISFGTNLTSGSATTPSFISLGTNPTPGSPTTPSFISLEARQQERSDPSGRKPEPAPDKDGSTELGSAHESSSKRTLLSIRPSFMAKKFAAQDS